jgi:hypothetical protein
MRRAYKEAAALFAAMTLNRSYNFALQKKGDVKSALEATLKKHIKLIEMSVPDGPFYSLTQTPSVADWKEYLKETSAAREALDVFTTVRLQVARAGGNPSRNVTLPLYAKLAPKGFAETNMKELYKERTLQGPCLWVAARHNAYLVTQDLNSKKLPKLLQEEAHRQEEFRSFCSKLIGVLQVLRMKESSWIKDCTGVKDVDLKEILPTVPEEIIAELKPQPRRAATSIKRAQR